MPQSPFPTVCIALGFPSVDELLSHARAEYEAGERFLEFRLDYLVDPMVGLTAVRKFSTKYTDCTLLVTCRRRQNQGRFIGSIEEQLKVLEAAIEAGAHAIDIEVESAENCRERLARLRAGAYLLLSYHNYGGTPPRMEAVLKRMTRIPADGYKIVTTARKPSDTSRVLDLPRDFPRVPMVVLAMGEIGFPTRVLSPSMGGIYTYAAPNAAAGTANGQVPAKTVRGLYRVGKFSKNAQIFGVIGDPIQQSISPVVHNRAFQAKRIDAVYLPLLVNPGRLKDFFVLAEELPLAGFSVTIPHKQRILRYLDAVEPIARRIGAVNTVWKKQGKWRGTNTDAAGVTVPLAKRLKLAKSTVLVVGNGGAARSAAFALADAGATITITGRNLDRVRALAAQCNAEALGRDQAESRKFDAVVHATSLGMAPNTDKCFFNGKIPSTLVFDMVYNPLETTLIRRARDQRSEVILGMEMFVEQAVRQFEIFSGERAPRAVMEKAAAESLAAKKS